MEQEKGSVKGKEEEWRIRIRSRKSLVTLPFQERRGEQHNAAGLNEPM